MIHRARAVGNSLNFKLADRMTKTSGGVKFCKHQIVNERVTNGLPTVSGCDLVRPCSRAMAGNVGRTVKAIIYLAAGLPMNASFARLCLDHCVRRGYEICAILRDWNSVHRVLIDGQADVVVNVPGHWHPEAHRCADNDTTDLTRYRAEFRRPSNDGPAGKMSTRDVREVLDGNGPAPVGIDPASIAAARRIARRLNSSH